MDTRFIRTQMLLGEDAMERLATSRVAVFGLGGVGGHVVEALARSGIGALDLIDNDTVALSNLNRQIIATENTLGELKTEAAKARVLSVNPNCRVTLHNCFFLPENADTFDFSAFDYVVDAIDTVSGKLAIIEKALAAGVPVISSMGTGNKLNPAMLTVSDISETSYDPLARVMRRELKKRGITSLKVVWSREKALTPAAPPGEADKPSGSRRSTPGSTPFVPGCAGLILASEVVRDLLSL
ncbi:MAG: tRNA threonylcarbamoyladenosine dehydratase [Lachnospiraceae bacterium]|nr:tRNA threonylcarbamoyladenosine dehydratase [Lachnospiraceae bacterium]MEE3378330.1 tRNA threonylcarbamoyladenosine dehydratase [Lachnospiraceae bacterium]MEE3437153.1 tRNA threonylcarbamoyladenosine dehydratase [Lachnospiraceae bacterium]